MPRTSFYAFSLGVLRLVHRCGLQGLSLLNGNSVQTLLGLSTSLGIGHSKAVVGLNSSVNSAITWDGFSELLTLSLGLYAVELGEGFLLSLSIALISVSRATLPEEGLRVFLHLLFSYNFVRYFRSPECVLNFRWDWLLKAL